MIGLLSFYMKYYSGVYNMNVACFQKVVENDFLPNSISFEPNEEVRARQMFGKSHVKGWGGGGMGRALPSIEGSENNAVQANDRLV